MELDQYFMFLILWEYDDGQNKDYDYICCIFMDVLELVNEMKMHNKYDYESICAFLVLMKKYPKFGCQTPIMIV